MSRRRIGDLGRDERGAMAVFIVLGLVAFLGSAALAVDLGHLMNIRAESQRVADVAALAGTSAFVDAAGGGLQPTAEQRAIDFAAQNVVDGAIVAIGPPDIEIDVPNERVRVTIRHSEAAGNPIQTLFARMLGVDQVDVVTTATAQAFPATSETCILPWVLVDGYLENGGDPDRFGDPPDYYEPFDPTLAPPSPTATGLTEASRGLQLLLEGAQTTAPGEPDPEWYYPVVSYMGGGTTFRDQIAGCTDPETVYGIGDPLRVEAGDNWAEMAEGIDLLIARAPTHIWSAAGNCVVDTAASDPSACVSGSPRLRPVPLMDPGEAPGSGQLEVPITNWAGLFIEGREGTIVRVRLTGHAGLDPVEGGSAGSSGALSKIVRLIR